ncbi:MAG: hypothetical protein ACAI43_19405 [Phycisphaerae bacterium]|nr:hypothetical protein [Tepidisphaeraceae bacterium]
MAKGKYSTALFEVIAKGKLPPRGSGPARPDAGDAAGAPSQSSAGGSLATPKWWFKSRTKTESKTIAPGQAVSAATSVAVTPEPDEAPLPDEPVARREAAAPAVVSGMEIPGETTITGARVQPVSVRLDPERQQINLRLSYTSAMIGGFGLVVVIGVAVLIGKGLSRGPTPAIAGPTTPQLRQGPANPNVLNVPARRPETPTGAGVKASVAGTGTPAGTRGTPPARGSEPAPPTTFFTDDPRRTNGLNYVIIQSYPDRDTADKAAEFLTKHGIACTVEKGLPAWPLPWPEGVTVVGIRGFTRITGNADADAYIASINAASQKFAGNRGIKAFQPLFYKWRKSN